MTEAKIETGFDRGIDFEPMKDALIADFQEQYRKFKYSKFVKRSSKALIFIIIELIQLRNGSRITEAIEAFKLFVDNGINNRVVVKLCKSESKKQAWVLSDDKKTKVLQEITTKPRYRGMMFPTTWIGKVKIRKLIDQIIELNPKLLTNKLLKKSICKYMLRHHETNTHSLRYAFINHLLHTENKPMTEVAKFVGHTNVNQLVTYTQHKNSDKIFDLDL